MKNLKKRAQMKLIMKGIKSKIIETVRQMNWMIKTNLRKQNYKKATNKTMTKYKTKIILTRIYLKSSTQADPMKNNFKAMDSN